MFVYDVSVSVFGGEGGGEVWAGADFLRGERGVCEGVVFGSSGI